MIVILEGGDKVGKSTLAHVLQLEQGFAHYVHLGIPDKNPLDFWMENLKDIHTSIVVDRSHITHRVYRRLYPADGDHIASPLEEWIMDGWFKARGAIIVKCIPPLLEVLKNAEKDPDGLHHSPDEVVKTYNEFLKPFDTTLPVIKFDYTKDRMYPIPQILRGLEIEPLPFNHVGLGESVPDILFVDYAHNFNNKKCRGSVLLRSGGGELFRRALEEIGLTWSDYHLTNALWGDTLETLHQFEIPDIWKQKKMKVVALGQKASNELKKRDIRHLTIPHPDWWNKFRHKEPLNKYVNLIMGAI